MMKPNPSKQLDGFDSDDYCLGSKYRTNTSELADSEIICCKKMMCYITQTP